ncbi:prostaglandin reductase 1-like isoform X2 [Tribolium madens]|uniref:prostaglandin reductase 1-like isoform X2 n=1 Tax=Tribolium madens TaxID=41895 RepID=UPI001CF75086|nr:prostaglandin reductase 1-like isoform X2 [Tribolium madens]
MASIRSTISAKQTRMVIAKKITINKRFDGMPKPSDFKTIEEELPPLKTNEFLAEAVFLSVDPYMRAYAHNIPLGATMVGTQVAKIIESRNEKYPVGKHVVGKFDWRSHTISSGLPSHVQGAGNAPAPYLVPDLGDLPMSYLLGVLGMPGSTAYFGLLDVCMPKCGEIVAVSGAAGAVGSIVGQIAKIGGCKVVGITGSERKGRFLVDQMGFDGFVNYKTDDIAQKLDQLVPEGIDCYFDNVAGEISSAVIRHMREYGRISVCGSISSYNYDVSDPPRVVQHHMVRKQLTMKGFQNYLYQDRASEAFQKTLNWLQKGKMKYCETITEGFDNMVQAFIEMLQGKNLGKAIVKV